MWSLWLTVFFLNGSVLCIQKKINGRIFPTANDHAFDDPNCYAVVNKGTHLHRDCTIMVLFLTASLAFIYSLWIKQNYNSVILEFDTMPGVWRNKTAISVSYSVFHHLGILFHALIRLCDNLWCLLNSEPSPMGKWIKDRFVHMPTCSCLWIHGWKL